MLNEDIWSQFGTCITPLIIPPTIYDPDIWSNYELIKVATNN